MNGHAIIAAGSAHSSASSLVLHPAGGIRWWIRWIARMTPLWLAHWEYRQVGCMVCRVLLVCGRIVRTVPDHPA